MIFEQKQPIILSFQNPVVELFLIKIQSEISFEGVEFLRSSVQQTYWVVVLEAELRRIKNHCLLCRKRSPSFVQPQMADLSSEKLGFNQPPFAVCHSLTTDS